MQRRRGVARARRRAPGGAALVIRFPDGGNLSIEFTDQAPDDDHSRLGAWLELRAQDPAAVMRAALGAGLPEVKHPGRPFEPGKTVRFPNDTCAACPLRQRCTTSSARRSVSIHPDETLLAEPLQRQQPRKGAKNCANASRSSTRLPTSATGKAAALVTSAPARTYSTCGASPSSTTSTSSPSRPSPMVTS